MVTTSTINDSMGMTALSGAEAEAEDETEAEAEAEVAPIPPPVPANLVPEAITIGTGRLIPLKRLFTDTQVWTGSSSSAAAAGHNPEDLTLSHIRSDLDALHRRVRHIEEDDYQEPPYALPEALMAPATHIEPRDPYVQHVIRLLLLATDNEDSPTRRVLHL
ncbi:hypothetical protein Tco_0618670 [Tanacetum coccineum]